MSDFVTRDVGHQIPPSAPGIFEACCGASEAGEWFAYLWPVRDECDGLHRPFLRWLIERARS